MEKRNSAMAEDQEKTREESTSSFELNDRDEALRLVGLERAETFTQDQYLRVRRKLVSSHSSISLVEISDRYS